MRELRLHGPGDVRIAEAEEPTPGAGESLVRVTDVGLCGSDLHWFGEGSIGDARLVAPVGPGREFAGVVEGGPVDGRLLAIAPGVPCGPWFRSRAGLPNLGPTVRFSGH